MALKARDSGKYEEAGEEFRHSVASVEPQSIAGPLKRAFAAMMTMSVFESGKIDAARAEACLSAAEGVLRIEPGHPYASDAAAIGNTLMALAAVERGEDPEPRLRAGLSLLEPVIKRYPRFLWGLNDLGNLHLYLGIVWQLRGRAGAKEELQRALEYFSAAAALDATYNAGPQNSIGALGALVDESHSPAEVQGVLAQTDAWFAKCRAINARSQQCFDNNLQVYARAASRTILMGGDPRPLLDRALANLAETHKLGGPLLDAEQGAALSHLVDAQARVQRHEDPGSALLKLHEDLKRCLALAQQDAMCRTLDAQAEWVTADWLAQQNQPVMAKLEGAVAKATLATQSPELYPDAWQTLAEAYLRLSRATAQPQAKTAAIRAGLAAVAKALAINPNHAHALATRAQLQQP